MHVIGIRPQTSSAGILIRFLVFFFSGLQHALVSLHLGNRCAIWEEIVWFLGNFVALYMESIVVDLVKGRLSGRLRRA